MAGPKFNAVVGTRRIPRSQGSQRDFAIQVRESLASVTANIEEVLNRMQAVTPEAVEAALTPIFIKSQEYCPVLTGNLMESGNLRVYSLTDNKVRGEISYGDNGRVMYAAYVHERVDLWHEPPTRSKFLQAALEEGTGEVRGNLIEMYKAFVGF